MFADVHTPDDLVPDALDDYLKNGWFRAGKTIFTTNFLHFNGVLHSAIWLRIALKDFELSKSQEKKQKLTARFSFAVRSFVLTQEKEELYAAYKTGISFSTADSIHQLLFDYQPFTAFNSYEVAVYDGSKLVGLGVFDLGGESAAGIVSFSHPDYKKYSLGAAIILQKIQFSKKQGYTYFYPGYFAPGYSAFDYKLNLGKGSTEFFDSLDQRWLPMHTFDATTNDPIKTLYAKLRTAKAYLEQQGIYREILIYDFFDVNFTRQFCGQGLFDVPIFLPIQQRNQYEIDVMTYDLFSQNYVLLRCEVVYFLQNTPLKNGHYNQNMLRAKETLVEASSVDGFLFTTY